MSFQDRPYYREQNPFGSGRMSRSFGLPPMSKVIKNLLIINGVVYLIQMIAPGKLEFWFAAIGQPWIKAIQIWRLLSFQFLHGSLWHLLVNMMVLFFFGSTLVKTWGSRRFLIFYLFCGAVGGSLFVLAGLFGYFSGFPLVGASGGLLGIMAACALLYPQMKVLLFPIPLPIPIRILVFFITVGYIINVLRNGPNAGGDICHLGGMATGFLWVIARPYLAAWSQKTQQGSFEKKQQDLQKLQFEIDRILAKVHDQGIQSLTKSEKQILQQATQHQQRK